MTDADNNARLGIAVTSTATTNGSWFYTINGGVNWRALGAVSGTSARLLAAEANSRLYFKPDPNDNGLQSAALMFRAWDRTLGVNGSLRTTASNGGVTAFSAGADTASIKVT